MSTFRKKIITVLAVLFCALLCISTALFIPKNERTAEANSVSVALNISGDNNKGFNSANLKTLISKIDSGSTTYDELSTNLGAGNGEVLRTYAEMSTNTAVKLGGYDWNVVAASKNQKGEVIVTLWLAKGAYTSTFSDSTFYVNASSLYSPCEYGCSLVRSTLTGKDYATSLNLTKTGEQNQIWKTFLSNYGGCIDTPYEVCGETGYQATENMPAIGSAGSFLFLSESYKINEAGIGTGGWGNQANKDVQNCITYGAWKDDKLWIPSVSETLYSIETSQYGLWGLVDNAVRADSYNTCTRVGYGPTYGAADVWYYGTTGAVINVANTATSAFSVRPALHLNLAKVMQLTPSDIEVTYTGANLPVSTIYDIDDDLVPWYVNTIYRDNNSVEYEYTDKDNSVVTAPLDVGEYKAKMTLLTPALTMGFKWTSPDSATDSKTVKINVKEKPVKVKFTKGTSNDIFADNQTVTSGVAAEYPAVKFDNNQIATTDTDNRKPSLKIKYQSTGSTPEIPDDDAYNEPTIPGTYRATVELYYEDSSQPVNYVLDPDSKTYVDFEIKPAEVAKPTLGNTNLTYNGAEQTVTVSGLPANNATTNETTVTYTVKKGEDIVEDSEHTPLKNLTGTSFKVIDEGTYKVIFSIVSDKQDTHVWSGEDNSDDLEISFTVKKKRIKLSFSGSSDLTSGSWTLGKEINFSVTINGVCTKDGETEKIVLYVSYTGKDGNGSTEAPDQGGYTYTLPSTLEIGSNYKLSCKLAENQPVNDNYVIEDSGAEVDKIEKEFEITATDATFKKSNLKWQYKNTDIDGNKPQYFGESNKVTYNGKTFFISLDTSNLEELGVAVDVDFEGFNKGFDGELSAKNASSTAYTVRVRIKALSDDYNFEDQTYTFEWYIDKADFDLSTSTIKWKYNARGVDKDFPVDGDAVKYEAPYEGGQGAGGTTGQIKVFLSGLPTGLTAEYNQAYDNTGYDLGKYTTKIIRLKSNDDNYNHITDFSEYDWATREWEIVKHILPTESGLWSQADYLDEHVTVAPELDTMPYNVDLEYKYYDNASCMGADIAFEDLTYTEGQEKTYYVKAFIKNSADMDKWGLDEISPTANNPHKFVVGANRIAVEIEVSGGGMYDGTPQSAKIELVGTYSDIDLDAFSITYYNSDGGVLTGAPTDVGTYKVKIALKGDYADSHFIKNNKEYELVITTRILEEPKYEGALTYNGEEQDIAKLVGLPDGWENYLEITINGNSGSKVRDVGTYTILFKIKESDIAAGNVAWKTADTAQKTSPRTLKLNVNQLVLHAKKWSKNGYYTALEFEEENGNKFVTYTVKDANGNLVTESEFYAHPDDEYIVEVAIGEEHGNNVRIEYAGGVNPQLRFIGNSTDEGDAAELEEKKNSAKEELEKEAKAKKDAVDADVNLTPEEKKAAKDEIDKELEEGKAEIDKATDKDGVDKALGEGKKEIDDTADLAQGKGAAKSELDKAAQAKKDAIDADPDLTDEEKAAAKAEVDKELEEGKKAIDSATDVSGVQSVESTTKTNIENIKPVHKGGSFPWWILAVIAGTIVLLTVVIIVVVKRRNADDEDEFDDFYDDEYDYEEEEVDDDGDEAFEF